jgi:hypothetical protein
MARIEFDTSKFERAHGKAPRGTGSWAFCPAGLYDRANYLDHVFWHSGSYGQAKRAAAAHFAARDVSVVVVCS